MPDVFSFVWRHLSPLKSGEGESTVFFFPLKLSRRRRKQMDEIYFNDVI